MLRSLRSQCRQQGRRDAATRCVDRVCVGAAGSGSEGLELAGGRPGVASLLVRSRAPVRGRSASWPRHRLTGRSPGARSCGRRRLVRRHGADGWKDCLHSVALGLHGDARAPGVDRRRSRPVGRRGGYGGDGGTERRRRLDRAVRLLRRPPDRRRAGLRRPFASAACAHAAGGAARGSRRSGICSRGAGRACGAGEGR